MRRGLRVLIVAVVAIGTNIGLHAAFGWCGNSYWGKHKDQNGDCDHYRGHWNGYGGCGWNHGCADPWNTKPNNGTVDGVKDTVPR